MSDSETELKLQLDATAMTRLPRLAWLRHLRRGKGKTRRQSTIYFDTPDLRLRKSGVTLRVRITGQQRLQTIKTAACPGSLTRNEWERPVPGNAPDLMALSNFGAAAVLAGVAEADVGPIFRTDIRRTVWTLGGDDWEVEMVADVGDVVAGTTHQAVSEVEFELVRGPVELLYQLARDLATHLPVRMHLLTKSERGYALLEHKATTPSKWRSPSLPADASTIDAFRAVGRSCLAHLLANEDCLRATGDPEAIHQMRVALRRLRSAAGVFAPVTDAVRTAAVQSELKWLLGQLGPARDIDVFIDEILAPVAAAMPGEDGLQRMLNEFRGYKGGRYEQARTALASSRCAQVILGIGEWIEAGHELAGGIGSEAKSPATPFARTLLEKRDRKIRKAARKLADMTPEDRHTLRIGIKKLRYAAEFFASLFPEKRTRRYLATLATLQDGLGTLNDIAVARGLLRDSGCDSWGAGLVIGWHAARARLLMDATARAQSSYLSTARFWR